MKLTKFFVFLTIVTVLAACYNPDPKGSHDINPGGYTGANNRPQNAGSTDHGDSASHENKARNLTEVPRPQNIADMTARRGEQDQASPTLKFIEPTDGATVNSSTVKVKLALAGDLKGYKPMKDMTIFSRSPSEPKSRLTLAACGVCRASSVRLSADLLPTSFPGVGCFLSIFRSDSRRHRLWALP